jgi:uncharacterized protein YkwD
MALAAVEAPARGKRCAGAHTAFSKLSAKRAARSVVCLINAERGRRGLPGLHGDKRLNRAAKAHSKDMYTHGIFDHTGSDGSDAGQRMKRQGYPWRAWGENIALGYPTPAEVMSGWMASEGHCENILASGFIDVGFGFKTGSKGGPYSTQVFGANPNDPAGSENQGPQKGCPYR